MSYYTDTNLPLSAEEVLAVAKGQLHPASYPRELIETDGKTTSLWHRQHEWSLANYAPNMPTCHHCGGKADPRLGFHHMCEERHKRGLPITKLDCTPVCPCMACAKANKAAIA